ncbi:MAG: hypothetical protein HKN47_05410 [Pirellulaceae bacterium]|nr:hypothetical protein [Pirellulaceae bacterium]
MTRNPYEPSTPVPDDAGNGSPDSWVRQHASWVSVVVCGLPLISVAYVWVFWLLASVSLGQRARPGIHDPGGFLFGIPMYLHVVLMLFSFAIAPVALFVGHWRRSLLWHAIAYIFCLILAIVLFRADILQATTWIAD